MDLTLERFAASVEVDGPVTCVGGRTQWAVGGPVDPAAREVRAPSGVVAHEPDEMIVRVRAGTSLAELSEATAPGGQMATLEADDADHATVGGVLACGLGGRRRLGWGPPRDSVLEVTAVGADGRLVRAGAPLVKNVTGYDLCRLFTGSLGTLALLGEVVLRCRPRPEAELWWAGTGVDPFALFQRLYRPLAVLWDGTTTWVGLAGFRADIEQQRRAVLAGFEEVAGPPDPPAGSERYSLPPARLRDLGSGQDRLPGGTWLAEVGVGVLHGPAGLVPRPGVPEEVARLNRRVKERFDPEGRLNPGRSPLTAPLAGAGAR